MSSRRWMKMRPTPLILGLYAATFMLLSVLLGGCGLYGDNSADTDVQVSIEQSTEFGDSGEETAAPSGQSTGEETEGILDAPDKDIVEEIAGGGLLIALVGILLYAASGSAFAARKEFRLFYRCQVVAIRYQRH